MAKSNLFECAHKNSKNICLLTRAECRKPFCIRNGKCSICSNEETEVCNRCIFSRKG